MRALKFITGHVIYNPAYTYKFQLKTTLEMISTHCVSYGWVSQCANFLLMQIYACLAQKFIICTLS